MSRREKKEGAERPIPWRALGVILAVGVIANLLVWFWPREEQATQAFPTYPAEVVAQGEEIYRANCATCHGPAGQGDPVAGVPALNGSMHAWHHGDAQIAGFLRSGVGRMPAVGAGWSDQEITAVTAFVKQWWDAEQRAYQAQVSQANP